MSTIDGRYLGIVLEQIRDEVQAVHEAVDSLRDQLGQVPKRDEFEGLKGEVKATRAAVTGHSSELQDHERRITALEAA